MSAYDYSNSDSSLFPRSIFSFSFSAYINGCHLQQQRNNWFSIKDCFPSCFLRHSLTAFFFREIAAHLNNGIEQEKDEEKNKKTHTNSYFRFVSIMIITIIIITKWNCHGYGGINEQWRASHVWPVSQLMSEMTMVPNRSGVITNGVAGGLVGEGEGKQKEKTKTNSMTRSLIFIITL